MFLIPIVQQSDLVYTCVNIYILLKYSFSLWFIIGFFFNWRIIALQSRISFCCTAVIFDREGNSNLESWCNLQMGRISREWSRSRGDSRAHTVTLVVTWYHRCVSVSVHVAQTGTSLSVYGENKGHRQEWPLFSQWMHGFSYTFLQKKPSLVFDGPHSVALNIN